MTDQICFRMGLKMNVSVVICTFNRPKDCKESVNAVLNQANNFPTEVVVVDDCSKIPFKFDDDRVHVIHNPVEVGIAGSRNIGAKASSGDVVCYIDDDVVAPKDWVAMISSKIRHGADMAGGVAEPIYLARPPVWWMPRLFGFFVGIHNRDMVSSNLAIRKQVFEKIGYFNESLGRKGGKTVSHEDIEFRERARIAGLRLTFDKEIKVYHKVRPNRMRIGYLIHRSWGEGASKALLKERSGRFLSASMFSLSRETFAVFKESIKRRLIFPMVFVLIFILQVVYLISVFYNSRFSN
jgi:glycosyltransferase involved in cell wall biosynthesis